MHRKTDPILVLDSGLGGLTVVRALMDRLPDEKIIYFGDSARLPYGSKTQATVTSFVRQIIHWGLTFQPKCIVIACNTASALAFTELRQEFSPTLMTGVIEPGAKAAAVAAGEIDGAGIGIIATEATIRSQAYQMGIKKRRHRVRLIYRATPLLVSLIEEGRQHDDPLVRLALQQYLDPMLQHDLNVLVLGCTHYPLLKPVIQDVVGSRVKVIDAADRCAEDVASKLRGRHLLAPEQDVDLQDHLRVFVSDDPERFARLAPRFLGFTIPQPTLVRPETLHESVERNEMVRLPA